MTETKNLGLKLPDPTDMQNVEDLNENFRKIDEELGGEYYELDLREIVTWDLVNERTPDSFDLTLHADKIDLAGLYAALMEGKKILLRAKILEMGLLVEVESDLTLVLDTLRSSDNLYQINKAFTTALGHSGMGAELAMRTDVDNETGYYCTLFFSRAVSTSDSEEDAMATNVSVVKAEGTVTITATLKDGGESVTVIDIDENDTPTKITTNGVECPISWEGF